LALAFIKIKVSALKENVPDCQGEPPGSFYFRNIFIEGDPPDAVTPICRGDKVGRPELKQKSNCQQQGRLTLNKKTS
jgi:hypothetical protein